MFSSLLQQLLLLPFKFYNLSRIHHGGMDIGETEPDDAQSKEYAGDQARPGIEGAPGISRVERRREGMIGQCCQPGIAIPKPLP